MILAPLHPGHAMSPTSDLDRFVLAQDQHYADVLAELSRGRKTSHWMWYIFPQVAGLGKSSNAIRYGIRDLDEARAYLAHPVLGPRLLECVAHVVGVRGRSAAEIFDGDDKKLRSCATLFAQVSPVGSPFHQLLDQYFEGEADARTLKILAAR